MGAGATVSGSAVDRVLAVGIAVTALGATVLAWQAVGGPAYLAADGLLGAAALWRDRRARRLLPGRVGLALLATIVQAVMMLTLIRVLH